MTSYQTIASAFNKLGFN